MRAGRVRIQRDAHLLADLVVNPLESADRSVKCGIFLPSANQGIEIMMNRRAANRRLPATAIVSQPFCQPVDLRSGKSLDGMFDFGNGTHRMKLGGTAPQFKSSVDCGYLTHLK